MRNGVDGVQEENAPAEEAFSKPSREPTRSEIESELKREVEFHRVVQLGVTRLKVIVGLAVAVIGAVLVFVCVGMR